jgi:ATP-binding cassette subfamily C protein
VPVERIHTRLPAPKGHVQVDQVGLRGPDGRPMLFGVSLEVRPGEMLGIIGPSGSGKTTLAKVIAGAIVPEIGTVRVDGAQLADWDPDDLAQHMGFLPQEPSLFEGTIKENISRFDNEANGRVDEQVVAAAQSAGVHELILRLPQGYDTRLGPLGSGLSAGQAQRVALARALYGDPAVLILDEPNAFLDADGETSLLAAVEAAIARGASVIMVAHRRTVLRGAHRLLVMDAGRPKLLGPAAEVAARLAGPAASESAETVA